MPAQGLFIVLGSMCDSGSGTTVLLCACAAAALVPIYKFVMRRRQEAFTLDWFHRLEKKISDIQLEIQCPAHVVWGKWKNAVHNDGRPGGDWDRLEALFQECLGSLDDPSDIYIISLEYKNIEVIDWLHSRGVPWNWNIMKIVADYHQGWLLEYLWMHHAPTTIDDHTLPSLLTLAEICSGESDGDVRTRQVVILLRELGYSDEAILDGFYQRCGRTRIKQCPGCASRNVKGCSK